jgi:diphthamide biosynthesis protein 7
MTYASFGCCGLQMFDTIWPSDSVEFCPDNPRNIFVCGTYKLDQPPEAVESPLDETENANSTPLEHKKQHRRGKCLVFEVGSRHRREL